ncbi:MAG: asparagine synthase-related protein [Mycobacteriales bacterium]
MNPDLLAEQSLYRMTPWESAVGYLHGLVPAQPFAGTATSPRGALETAALAALTRPPCVVSFSGGRDSSAVLALVVDVARRHGLAEPIAVTSTFPQGTTGYEGDWQELVIRHLGVKEWIRLAGAESKDALGPEAQAGLLRCGAVWPPMAHDKGPLYEVARGGSLLTGEGGDEILGNQRITPVVGTYRRRLRPTPRVVRAVSLALAPVPVRRMVLRRDHHHGQTWLREAAARANSYLAVAVEAAQPLVWSDGVRQVLRRRSSVIGLGTLAHLAAHHDVVLHHPLRDRGFVASFAAAGGRYGYLGRSEAMRVLVGDLLPPQILSRASKAYFNSSVFGPGARTWARSWDGKGVPEALVDAEALRAEWLSDLPHAGSLALLHSTWLQAHESATGTRCASYPDGPTK